MNSSSAPDSKRFKFSLLPTQVQPRPLFDLSTCKERSPPMEPGVAQEGSNGASVHQRNDSPLNYPPAQRLKQKGLLASAGNSSNGSTPITPNSSAVDTDSMAASMMMETMLKSPMAPFLFGSPQFVHNPHLMLNGGAGGLLPNGGGANDLALAMSLFKQALMDKNSCMNPPQATDDSPRKCEQGNLNKSLKRALSTIAGNGGHPSNLNNPSRMQLGTPSSNPASQTPPVPGAVVVAASPAAKLFNEDDWSWHRNPAAIRSGGTNKQTPVWKYFVYNKAENLSRCVVEDCTYTLKGPHTSTLACHLKKHQAEYAEFQRLKGEYTRDRSTGQSGGVRMRHSELTPSSPTSSTASTSLEKVSRESEEREMIDGQTMKALIGGGMGLKISDAMGFKLPAGPDNSASGIERFIPPVVGHQTGQANNAEQHGPSPASVFAQLSANGLFGGLPFPFGAFPFARSAPKLFNLAGDQQRERQAEGKGQSKGTSDGRNASPLNSNKNGLGSREDITDAVSTRHSVGTPTTASSAMSDLINFLGTRSAKEEEVGEENALSGDIPPPPHNLRIDGTRSHDFHSVLDLAGGNGDEGIKPKGQRNSPLEQRRHRNAPAAHPAESPEAMATLALAIYTSNLRGSFLHNPFFRQLLEVVGLKSESECNEDRWPSGSVREIVGREHATTVLAIKSRLEAALRVGGSVALIFDPLPRDGKTSELAMVWAVTLGQPSGRKDDQVHLLGTLCLPRAMMQDCLEEPLSALLRDYGLSLESISVIIVPEAELIRGGSASIKPKDNDAEESRAGHQCSDSQLNQLAISALRACTYKVEEIAGRFTGGVACNQLQHYAENCEKEGLVREDWLMEVPLLRAPCRSFGTDAILGNLQKNGDSVELAEELGMIAFLRFNKGTAL